MSGGERMDMHLARDAGFTDGIWRGGRRGGGAVGTMKSDACDKVFGDKGLDLLVLYFL